MAANRSAIAAPRAAVHAVASRSPASAAHDGPRASPRSNSQPAATAPTVAAAASATTAVRYGATGGSSSSSSAATDGQRRSGARSRPRVKAAITRRGTAWPAAGVTSAPAVIRWVYSNGEVTAS